MQYAVNMRRIFSFLSGHAASLSAILLLTTSANVLGLNSDGDSWDDIIDNCPFVDNEDQSDSDGDGVGDCCDGDFFGGFCGFIPDSDSDGINDSLDNCPMDSNFGQRDNDKDGAGDACDSDDDNDGVLDTADGFPLASLGSLTDTDGDGRPNDCDSDCQTLGMTADTDDDNDGVLDAADAYPLISLGSLTDIDGDGRPNECDSNCQTLGMAADDDDDGDGIADVADAFPLDANESIDTDSDGIGNNADTDDDDDGVSDSEDAFPLDGSESVDTDSDGVGNNADDDDDNDGVSDSADGFPLISVGGLTDTDADGLPNDCDDDCLDLGMTADTDDDNDGVLDSSDAFRLDDSESVDTDSDGVGNTSDPDDDGDGLVDAVDLFPLNDFRESFIESDIEGDPIGITSLSRSGIDDPFLEILASSLSFNLDREGVFTKYQVSKRNTSGLWEKINGGFQLTEDMGTDSYLEFNGDQEGGWRNIDWSSPLIDEIANSNSGEVVDKSTYRFGVTEKGSQFWKIAYQYVREVYAINDTSQLVLKPNSPIKIKSSDVFILEVLAPNISFEGFTVPEIIGTWLIDGVSTSSSDGQFKCGERRLNCGGLIRFDPDGSATDTLADRSLTWSIDAAGSLELTFLDTGSTFSVQRFKKGVETSSVLITSATADRPVKNVQLMVKQQETLPAREDLLLDEYMNAGWLITDPLNRSAVDGAPIELWGFKLLPDGSGFQTTAYDPSYLDLGYVLPQSTYVRESPITWVYDQGILKIINCYYPYNDGDGCSGATVRLWHLVSVTDTRMYMLEIRRREYETDPGDAGSLKVQTSFVRPNFYQLAPTFNPEDLDRDGVVNVEDKFPGDPLESIDTDSDGVGNNADTDDDGDGVLDESDAFPLVSIGSLADTDGDGRPNDCDSDCQATGMTVDTDDDGDGVADDSDCLPVRCD